MTRDVGGLMTRDVGGLMTRDAGGLMTRDAGGLMTREDPRLGRGSSRVCRGSGGAPGSGQGLTAVVGIGSLAASETAEPDSAGASEAPGTSEAPAVEGVV